MMSGVKVSPLSSIPSTRIHPYASEYARDPFYASLGSQAWSWCALFRISTNDHRLSVLTQLGPLAGRTEQGGVFDFPTRNYTITSFRNRNH